MDPKACVLRILDDHRIEDNPKQAIARALFQARKPILRHWKGTEPPTLGGEVHIPALGLPGKV